MRIVLCVGGLLSPRLLLKGLGVASRVDLICADTSFNFAHHFCEARGQMWDPFLWFAYTQSSTHKEGLSGH